MRRLPVFVVVDVSESMAGSAITAMHDGMQMLLQALKKDPMVIEIGAMSIISFGGKAKVEVPLSSVLDIRIPSLDLSSGTSLGKAFDLLTSEVNSKVTKTTREIRGDYKPIVFLITDGQPTDDWRAGYAKFRKCYPSVSIHAVGCGDDVDFSILKEITPNTYVMRDMTAESFGKLFQCVTASVRSVTVSMMNGDGVKDDLAELSDGEVRKPTEEECRQIGESRQVLIPGMCSRTSRHFLIRYKKDEAGMFALSAVHPLEQKLAGGGASGGNINVNELNSNGFKCPHCGNAGMFYCNTCHAEVCIEPRGMHGHCPGCGWDGELTYGSFDLRKSIG